MNYFKQGFSQKQVQNFSLSYAMKLSCELLQLNSLQLKEYIEKELLDNPLYEVDIPIFSNGNSDMDYADSSKSLYDELIVQLDTQKVNLAVIELIISNCDANGYLKASFEELSKYCSENELNVALHELHNCLPYGIASKNLSECLSIQLSHLFPNDKITLTIVQNHLEDIAKNYTDKILKTLGISKDVLMDSVRRIQGLNPRPASEYNMKEVSFVKPDLIIINEEGKIIIQVPNYFTIRLNNFYEKDKMSKEDRKYIKEQQIKGKALMECITRRKESLVKIMEIMIERQSEYLLHKGYLEPLLQKDIAEQLNLHETTVSRALKEKYYEYENQVYPMKKLISKKMKNTSVDVIHQMIKELINNENHEYPYNDTNLCELLREKNFNVSRRTIAKYREYLRIPSASTRKRNGR